MNKIVYLAPRVLGLCFVIFLSLFSLDVFSESSGWQTVVALFIHLLPSLILLLAVIIAWKYDLVGAVVFLAGAIFYIWSVGLGRHWTWYAFISGPAALVGVLFILSWFNRKLIK